MKLTIPGRLRTAIALAVLEDEANTNGEHLFDGKQLVFACPMQAPEAAAQPGPRVPVRALLPAGMRILAFGEYLAARRPGQGAGALSREERAALLLAYERELVSRIAALLPDEVDVAG